MERSIFLFEIENLDLVHSWCKNLLPIENDSDVKVEQKAVYRLLPVTSDFKQVDPSYSKHQWVDGTFLRQDFEEKPDFICGGGNVPIKSLDDCLHQLADDLPCLGCPVHLYIFLSSGSLASEDSFIPLAGAALRLSQWHNARAVIVKIDEQLSTQSQKLSELIKGHDHCIKDVPQPLQVSWIGKVSVTDYIKNEGIVYPGFFFHFAELDVVLKQAFPMSTEKQKSRTKHKGQTDSSDAICKKTVCGRTIEVLQEVDLRTFPLFLLSPWSFTLETFDKGGQHLSEYVHENPVTGLLARLPLYQHRGEIMKCGDTNHLSTSAWKEYIITQSPSSSPELHKTDIPEQSHFKYLHLLMVPCSTQSSSTSLRSRSLLVRVVLNAEQISRNMVGVVREQNPFYAWNICKEKEGKNKHDNEDDNLADILNSLPIVKPETLAHLADVVSQIQRKTSAHNQDIKKKVDDVFEEVFKADETLRDFMLSKEQSAEESDAWMSEATCGLSRCPEWIAMMSGHTADASTMSTSASGSSLSRPTNKGKSDVSIHQILNYLKDQSTGKKRDTGSQYSRESSPQPCRTYCFKHDIYQYNTEDDFDLETKYAQIRDSSNFADTQSSFVTPQKKIGRPFRPILPTRSSPRTKLFTSRTSPVSKSKAELEGSKQTFKHPQFVRNNSSSIQRKRPASSLTPDPPVQPSHPVKCKLKISPQAQTSSPFSFSSTSASTPVKPNGVETSDLNTKPTLYKRVPFTTVMESSDPALRRSPRKFLGAQNSFSSIKDLKRTDSSQSVGTSQPGNSQTESVSSSQGSRMKRSERHMMRLKSIIARVLKEKDVREGDAIYDACSKNLLNVSIILLKALPNSKNLNNEMKSVVYEQVQQIINLEKRRSGIAI